MTNSTRVAASASAPATSKPEGLKVVKEISRPGIIFAIERIPKTRKVVFGGSDFHVYDLDLDSEKPEPRDLGAHGSYVTGIALAGKWAVSGGYDGRLIWWDLESGTQVRSLDAHRKWIRDVAASADGKTIASVADDMVCRLWDVESGEMLRELRGHEEQTPHHFPSMLYACGFSPDGKSVATADKVGHIVVWDVALGKSIVTMEAPGMYTWDPTQRRHSIGGIRSLAFSPDGAQLAVGGVGKVGNIDHLEGKARVEVFDWRKAERTHEFPADKLNGLVEHLAFHPSGDWLLAGGGKEAGFFIFLDLKGKNVLLQEKAPMYVHDIAMSEAGDSFIAAGHGKIAVIEIKA